MENNQSSSQAVVPLENHTSNEASTSEVQCGFFFFVIYGPLYGLVCILGLIGNSLSFAVLHKFAKNNVATYLLKTLAVTDNIFLLTASFVHMYPAMAMYFGLSEQLEPIYPYFQMYAWSFAHIIQMGTVWMMVLVAANRYIAVCKPLQATQLCTKHKVKLQIAALTLCIILYNIPRFFEYRYAYPNSTYIANATGNASEIVSTQSPEAVNVGLQSHQLYNILYENVSYCLFVFLIPLVTLSVLNLHLVRELKKAQKCREGLSSRSTNDENNITLVMIVIIIVFIVCQLPAAINQILYYIVDEKEHQCSHYNKYYHISNLLITTNSSVNFIIYCVFRRQFQQDLWALFCGKGSRSLKQSSLMRIHSSSYKDTSIMTTETTILESVPLKNNIQENHTIAEYKQLCS